MAHGSDPWLERWMSEQVGWRGLFESLREEAPHYATLLPQLPRLLHRYLTKQTVDRFDEIQHKILQQQIRRNRLLTLICLLLSGIFFWGVFISI